ncbi:hypothetical protein DKP78_19495 [Enterococcus faecium]|nr:hypothetical protein DKP78_19495 [Enterococcus faecium]
MEAEGMEKSPVRGGILGTEAAVVDLRPEWRDGGHLGTGKQKSLWWPKGVLQGMYGCQVQGPFGWSHV